jgi:hypothetical protein
MDLNELKRKMQAQQEKVINDQARATGFGDELKKAIEQNDATYRPFENDVNQSRNSYYNTTGQLLPELTKKAPLAGDPMLVLQALENERGIGGTRYQNAQDSLQRKKGSISDLIDSYNKTAQTELQKQMSLAELMSQQYQTAFQEDQARKAAAAQRAALTGFGGGGGQNEAQGDRPQIGDYITGPDGKPKRITGFNPDGTPIFEQDPGAQPAQKNFIQQSAQAFTPRNNAPIAQNLLGSWYKPARESIRQNQTLENMIQGANWFGNLFK